MNMLALVGT